MLVAQNPIYATFRLKMSIIPPRLFVCSTQIRIKRFPSLMWYEGRWVGGGGGKLCKQFPQTGFFFLSQTGSLNIILILFNCFCPYIDLDKKNQNPFNRDLKKAFDTFVGIRANAKIFRNIIR